jgi:hypothetical protein
VLTAHPESKKRKQNDEVVSQFVYNVEFAVGGLVIPVNLKHAFAASNLKVWNTWKYVTSTFPLLAGCL